MTCACQFTWGFVIYNRSFYKTSYKYTNPIFGDTHPGVEYLHYVASPVGTLKFGCNHAIGVSIDFHGQRLKINGLENFANDELFDSEHPGSVTNEGYDYSGGIGVTVGWISYFSDCVSFGLAYSPTVWMSRFNDYRGIVAREGRINIPQRFLGGIAIEMVNGLTVTFDIEHTKYNEVSPLNHPLIPNLDDHELGSDHGPGLGWMDQTAFRFGLDWQLNPNLDLRVGYIYHRDPTKSSETLFNSLVANILHRYVTWGMSWRINCCTELNFYGAYGFWNENKGRDSIPDVFGGGEVNLKEERWQAGFSWARFF
jgi:long-chain fatty acid transport protein